MHLSQLTIHDTRQFPLVVFRPASITAGYAVQWVEEMDLLLAAGQPFALVLPEGAHDEAHADRKLRGQWLKARRNVLSTVCLALVSVEPDAHKRRTVEAQLENLSRAFGVPQAVAANEAEAHEIALQYLARHASGAAAE